LLQFIEEAERSLHDAIMIVRRALKNSNVVAGGGAIDVSKIVTCLCLARAPLVLEILGVLCY
jgi:chaperonin GroEL (HSP60 family)